MVFDVSVDTSSVAGTVGAIELQFNPGGTNAQNAIASVRNMTGGTPGSVLADFVYGPVTGTITGNDLDLQNSSNTSYVNAWTFSNTFSFELSFDGVALDHPNFGPAGSTFGLFLWDSPDLFSASPLITSDGLVALFTVGPDGLMFTNSYPDERTKIEMVTPEPATICPVLLAGCAFWYGRRKRNANQQTSTD